MGIESDEPSESQESDARGYGDVNEVCAEEFSAALEKRTEHDDSGRAS